MAAVELLAGEDLAGGGPTLVLSRPRNVTVPAAIRYDGATRDFPLDDAGLYIEEYPTDQKVGLALIVVAGSLSGSPNIGSKLRAKRYLNPLTIRTEILFVIKVALADLLKAKEIALARVDVELVSGTRLLVSVVYENLLLNAASSTAAPAGQRSIVGATLCTLPSVASASRAAPGARPASAASETSTEARELGPKPRLRCSSQVAFCVHSTPAITSRQNLHLKEEEKTRAG